jgi:hypothetical protein
MMTTTSGGTSVGNTDDYALGSMATTGVPPTYSLVNQATSGSGQYWLPNAAGSTEGALIYTTSGSGATASVANLLILDGGPNGILVYNAPPGGTVSANADEYGYVGGANSHIFNPGAGTPITEVGTTGSKTGADTGTGLEGDLEFNGGFLDGGSSSSGTDNGANIAVGAEEAFMDPDTDQEVLGYIYSEGDQPGVVEEQVRSYSSAMGKYIYTDEDITPTIYFVTGLAPSILPTGVNFVPAPSPLLSCLGLMGLVGAMQMARKSHRSILS